MAVLTNKPVHFSRAIIEGLNLSRYFRIVYGGNSFETKKPDPQGAQILLKELQAAPHEAMMVGDSDVDIKTARNSGMYACGVTYGFGTESLRAHPPDIMLDTLSELAAHLKWNVLNPRRSKLPLGFCVSFLVPLPGPLQPLFK